MINNKKILAIIPARAGSKGLQNKNILNLNGKPLISYPINSAQESLYIDRILVSTDSEKIAKVALDYGAEIPYLRPSRLAKDITPSSQVILDIFEKLYSEIIDYEYFVFLEPTSPLTSYEDINKAIENLENSKKTALMSVAKVEATHPDFCLSIKNGKMIPYKSKPSSDLSRRQDIDELYFIDGSIYISKITKYLETKTFYHEDTLPFIVPYWKSFEIDTYLDLICVESIINNIEEIKQNDK